MCNLCDDKKWIKVYYIRRGMNYEATVGFHVKQCACYYGVWTF